MPTVACPHCGHVSRIHAAAAGLQAKCSRCQGRFAVPGDNTIPLVEPEPIRVPVSVVASPVPAHERRIPAPGRPPDGPSAGQALRFIAWTITTIFAVITAFDCVTRIHARDYDTSAVQQAGLAGETLVKMFAAYFVARAVDGATRR